MLHRLGGCVGRLYNISNARYMSSSIGTLTTPFRSVASWPLLGNDKLTNNIIVDVLCVEKSSASIHANLKDLHILKPDAIFFYISPKDMNNALNESLNWDSTDPNVDVPQLIEQRCSSRFNFKDPVGLFSAPLVDYCVRSSTPFFPVAADVNKLLAYQMSKGPTRVKPSDRTFSNAVDGGTEVEAFETFRNAYPELFRLLVEENGVFAFNLQLLYMKLAAQRCSKDAEQYYDFFEQPSPISVRRHLEFMKQLHKHLTFATEMNPKLAEVNLGVYDITTMFMKKKNENEPFKIAIIAPYNLFQVTKQFQEDVLTDMHDQDPNWDIVHTLEQPLSKISYLKYKIFIFLPYIIGGGVAAALVAFIIKQIKSSNENSYAAIMDRKNEKLRKNQNK